MSLPEHLRHTEHSIKGSERSAQEYLSPLVCLTGEQYARMTFEELHRRICNALRGNRAAVVAEVLLPDGSHRVIRTRRKPSGGPGASEPGPPGP